MFTHVKISLPSAKHNFRHKVFVQIVQQKFWILSFRQYDNEMFKDVHADTVFCLVQNYLP